MPRLSSICATGVLLLMLIALPASAGEVVLEQAPAYNWYHGCGPTAAGMIFGYWDLHGLSNMFTASGSDLYQTSKVQDQISSSLHNSQYDGVDNSSYSHTNNSIACWFGTSVDPLGYGWSNQSLASTAFTGYASFRGYSGLSSYSRAFGPGYFDWNNLTTEIDAGRPLMFLVDRYGSGSTDHFITVIGYRADADGSQWYGCYDTYSEDETVQWKQFKKMAVGQDYGVFAVTYVVPPFMWNAASGDWSNRNNWTGSVMPASSVNDSAWIDNGGVCRITTGANASNIVYVGWHSNGTLNQSGGMLNVATLKIGDLAGSNGVYDISGGTLTAGELQLGMSGSGRLSISNSSANVKVTGSLLIGAGGTFAAVQGATVRLSGTRFDNRSQTPSALAGLAMANFIVQGGASNTLALEVAGQDMGDTDAGLVNNFALGTLTIGGTLPGSVKLVDLFDNQPGYQGTEALYVSSLVINSGSFLDLNGLHLYYHDYVDYGGTISLNGGSLAPLPEPGTLMLAAVGLVALIRRRNAVRMSNSQ